MDDADDIKVPGADEQLGPDYAEAIVPAADALSDNRPIPSRAWNGTQVLMHWQSVFPMTRTRLFSRPLLSDAGYVFDSFK